MVENCFACYMLQGVLHPGDILYTSAHHATSRGTSKLGNLFNPRSSKVIYSFIKKILVTVTVD